METFINLIALIMCLAGVVMVYDARIITKRLFGEKQS